MRGRRAVNGRSSDRVVDPASKLGCDGAASDVHWYRFAAHSTVTITLYSDPVVLGTATTDSLGSFSRRIAVPQTSRPEHISP